MCPSRNASASSGLFTVVLLVLTIIVHAGVPQQDDDGVSAKNFGPATTVQVTGVAEPSVPVRPAMPDEPPARRPGVSVLVHLAPRADRGPVRRFAANHGGIVKYEYTILPNLMNIRGIPPAAVDALGKVPGITRIEQDMTVHAHINDSTPLIRALQSQITGAGLSADGSGIRVCVIDTGIDSDSVMYSTRIDVDAGRDFVNNDTDPEDDHGHGSHVAGTAVGGDNLTVNFGCVGPEPFQGIAPRATLVGIKVLGATGSGTFSDVIAGINYGADQTLSGGRCDVINMSLGGGAFTGPCDSNSAAAAANAASNAGVVVVASSGNAAYANAMGTPACGSEVIAVGATYDDSFPNCDFPNQDSFTFGNCTDVAPSVDQINCYSNRSDELDVVGPGCITFSANQANSPNGIVGFCGTSMASPHVAGLAALLLDADSTLTPTEVRQLIRDGAIDLGPAGFDRAYGHGRIDVLKSLSLVGPACNDATDCDDSDLCTMDDCSGGSCANTPISCDDSDACTADNCDPVAGCANDPINCDDSDACTADSCDPVAGCANDPINCDDSDACTADSCDPVAGCANDPINCDDGDSCTVDSCDPVVGCRHVDAGCMDNDNCCPAACDASNDNDCSVSACNGNGTCETGEDCQSCPSDCPGQPLVAPGCGNGICEPGEDCVTCPTDCRQKPNGNPNNRYCCSGADCDPQCLEGGFTCGPLPDPFCCGDGSCDGGEDSQNCAIDCPAPVCSDGSCDPGEDACNCPADCGPVPLEDCNDGVDNDCDGFIDCDDLECQAEPACNCGPVGDACIDDTDCCSNKCKGPSGRKTCKKVPGTSLSSRDGAR